MATITQHAPGTFCWPELATSDQAGARKYYTTLFGWTANEMPMGESETYTLLMKGDESVGALYTMRTEEAKHAPPHWNSYVSVANADESAARAKELGGKLLMEPFDVMEMGRMAVIQDPTGAVFCVWQAKQSIGASILGAPGSLCWTELMTGDTAKAKAFYTGLFPWNAVETPMKEFVYTRFQRGEVGAGGMMPLPAPGIPPHWLLYFAVESCDRSLAKALELGGKTIMPAMEIPTIGRFAILTDPQGAAFALFQPLS